MALSARHQAEMERIKAIAHRLHILEKEVIKEPHSILQACSHCIGDCARSIPITSIFGFVCVLNGLYDIWETHTEITTEVASFIVDVANETTLVVLNEVPKFLQFAMFIHTVILLQAFAGAGVTREWLFGRHHGGAITCLECLMGACTGYMALMILVLLFLTMFALMLVGIPAVSLLGIVKSACQASDNAKEGVLTAMMSFAHDAHSDYISKAIERTCAEDLDLLAVQSRIFTAGMIYVVFGQAVVLVCHVRTLEQVVSQKDVDESERTERDIIVKFREARGETAMIDAI